MWTLCRVDLADVFTGARSARWVWGFVERVMVHPESVTYARLRGGENWPEWFGWTPTASRVLQGTNVAIAAAGGKDFAELPKARAVLAGPVTEGQMNAVAAQLISMV